jgi:hypothetical protein
MTSTYEMIRTASQSWRGLQRCHIALEFKDKGDAPIPFNLFLTPWRFSCRLAGSYRHLTNDAVFGLKKSSGFAVLRSRNAMGPLDARELRYAQSYHRKCMQSESRSTHTLVAAMHDDMPMLRSLCFGLADKIDMLVDTLDVKNSTDDAASHIEPVAAELRTAAAAMTDLWAPQQSNRTSRRKKSMRFEAVAPLNGSNITPPNGSFELNLRSSATNPATGAVVRNNSSLPLAAEREAMVVHERLAAHERERLAVQERQRAEATDAAREMAQDMSNQTYAFVGFI